MIFHYFLKEKTLNLSKAKKAFDGYEHYFKSIFFNSIHLKKQINLRFIFNLPIEHLL